MDFVKSLLFFTWLAGYRAKIAGVLLIVNSVALFIDAAGIDVLPNIEGTFEAALAAFSNGLGILGIRLAIKT